MVPARGNMRSGRDEFRETFESPSVTEKFMAILSQAGGTPPEGAETT